MPVNTKMMSEIEGIQEKRIITILGLRIHATIYEEALDEYKATLSENHSTSRKNKFATLLKYSTTFNECLETYKATPCNSPERTTAFKLVLEKVLTGEEASTLYKTTPKDTPEQYDSIRKLAQFYRDK